MTRPDFLRQLEAAHGQFDWILTADSGRQAERRRRPRFRLRCKVARRPDSSAILDPLRAVCYSETQQLFGSDAWADAAAALEMDPADAHAILAAANDETWTGPGGLRAPSAALLDLRRQLLEATGFIGPTRQQQPGEPVAVV